MTFWHPGFFIERPLLHRSAKRRKVSDLSRFRQQYQLKRSRQSQTCREAGAESGGSSTLKMAELPKDGETGSSAILFYEEGG
jgi:hypothetical protein